MDRDSQIIKDIFRMVKKNICQTAPFLYSICMSLDFVPVEKSDEENEGNSLLWSDGKRIFYSPPQILEQYQKKTLIQLEKALLHILLHGIMGHFEQWKGVENQELFDLCADIEVEDILGKLKIRYDGYVEMNSRHKMERIRSCREIYVQYLQQINAGRATVEGLRKKNQIESRDNHGFWKTDSKDDTKEDTWEHRKTTMTLNISSKEAEWLEDLCHLSSNEMKLNAGEKGSKGNDIGGETQNVVINEEGSYSFINILRDILEIKEDKKENEEQFDKALYSYGLDTYGDVALLEPADEQEDKQRLNTIVIAIDTSGSCAGELVCRFLMETRKLFKEIQEEYSVDRIVVIQCDNKIQEEVTYYSIESFLGNDEIKIKGFGGTDFRPVFNKVKELQNVSPIGCLIYFSDGQGTFPRREENFKTVFIMDELDRSVAVPEWIKCYYFNEGEEERC